MVHLVGCHLGLHHDLQCHARRHMKGWENWNGQILVG